MLHKVYYITPTILILNKKDILDEIIRRFPDRYRDIRSALLAMHIRTRVGSFHLWSNYQYPNQIHFILKKIVD